MNPYINTLRTPLSTTTQPPHSSSKQWRCPNQRLHLDGHDCVPTSPDSPIIDTPSKYRKMQARRNVALGLGNSQATTQPTPSGSPAGLHHGSPEQSMASVHSRQDGHDGEEQNQNVEHSASQDFPMPSSPPSHDLVERIPDTPLADLPSSPPLPLLTAANLRQLNSQPAHKGAGGSSSSNHSHASPPAPPPSLRSIPSSVAHRISRLVLRTKINAAKHQASEVQLQATRGALELALARVRREAARVNGWIGIAVALLLLCLAYAGWCQYNSAEFAFIEESRREWFGL
ncbi:hypothetical protein Q7P35_004842 [Cladosporium inversicolor]